jgi:hypothetical protein
MKCAGRGGQIRTDDPLLPKQMRYQAALRPDFLQSYPTRPHHSRRRRKWSLSSVTGAKMLAELRRNSCVGTQAAAVSRTLHRCIVRSNWARRALAKACALAECRASGEKIPEDLPLCCLDGQRDAEHGLLVEVGAHDLHADGQAGLGFAAGHAHSADAGETGRNRVDVFQVHL